MCLYHSTEILAMKVTKTDWTGCIIDTAAPAYCAICYSLGKPDGMSLKFVQ